MNSIEIELQTNDHDIITLMCEYESCYIPAEPETFDCPGSAEGYEVTAHTAVWKCSEIKVPLHKDAYFWNNFKEEIEAEIEQQLLNEDAARRESWVEARMDEMRECFRPIS